MSQKTANDAPPKFSKVETIKEQSNFLRGNLREELAAPTDNVSEESKQLLKFHGLYEQDDRDQRTPRAQGGGKIYSFMLRTRLPGGVLTAEQYLVHDELADRFANGTLRITTRECFQLHGIIKGDLKETIATLNQALITSLGACGDVVRNVVCCPAPIHDHVRDQVLAVTRQLSQHLLPRTRAYHELWIDNEKVYDGAAEPVAEQADEEPIYGKRYLPRKFKIGLALPGDNCVDVYTQDVGLIAVVEDGSFEGFNVLVGGGMGMNHTKADTFPRLGDPLGFVRPEHVIDVVEKIVTVQRDYGNRSDRKHARLKYLVDAWGVERFRSEVEARLGYSLAAWRPIPSLENELHLGWQPQGDGNWFLGISVENGRIADTDSRRLKQGLRAVVQRFQPGIRLTPNQDILLTDIKPADRSAVDELLQAHGIAPAESLSTIQIYSMACVALPTCGLALAEAERALPAVIDGLEAEAAALGLDRELISVRMTGCPNGCARPYVADLAFVGRSADQYMIFVGGSSRGTRLNTPYKDLVPRDQLVAEVRPLLHYFQTARQPGERFGDFCQRVGVDDLRAYAAHFHDQPTNQEEIGYAYRNFAA
ncbi:MAG: NADPH-dependent assimilatory sulfite reductase hemoprotein subunit [Caldilineaceae bacterium]|nr:NADPH-dependent assimilatory sulfite reductase hemoprotein subunit [Caldilineaceae bacterium]